MKIIKIIKKCSEVRKITTNLNGKNYENSKNK